MKVYAPPASIPQPGFRYETWQQDEADYKAKLAEHVRKTGWTGKLSGEVVSFPRADGYAQYMVAERAGTMALIHLPLGDAWSIPEAHARGLRKADIVALVRQRKAIAAMFPNTPLSAG